MTSSRIEHVAQALLAARRERSTRDATPFADALRDVADAYGVQAIVARGMTQHQGFPRYWKSGGAGRDAMLPHAALPAEGVWASPADARSWPFNFLLVEAEIALRLASEVTALQAAAISYEEARERVDAMTVAIELVDSRWQQGPRGAPALLKLADLQSHGALVLGEWVTFVPRIWAAQCCEVRIGSHPAALWRGTHSMGDPTWLLPAWLRHATREGQTVPGGTVVTTGSWCGMLPAAAGDRVIARFEGVGEASVQL
jgi:2-keto-4-pentenoate hydratase